jgi:hypothetical protein
MYWAHAHRILISLEGLFDSREECVKETSNKLTSINIDEHLRFNNGNLILMYRIGFNDTISIKNNNITRQFGPRNLCSFS